jgi:hypothetical protein
MAQDIEVSVVHGTHETLGLRAFIQSKLRVNRANCQIKFLKDRSGIIQLTVLEDIDLGGL